MDSTRYFIEQPSVILAKRILLLLWFFYCALVKLPLQWEVCRPDLFVLYLLYRTLFGKEAAFGVEKAWLLGIFANLCYPLYFGGLGALFVVIQSVVQYYRTRWVMYSAFQWFLVGVIILLPYQIAFLCLYKGGGVSSMASVGWYMYGANVVVWGVIVALSRCIGHR